MYDKNFFRSAKNVTDVSFFVVVALDVVPRHLVHLGVDAHALPLHVGVVVAVLVLVRKPLGFDVVGALESQCRVED